MKIKNNLFKEGLKFLKSDMKNDSPLKYDLPRETELTEEQIGKNGVLGNEKFERREGGEEKC